VASMLLLLSSLTLASAFPFPTDCGVAAIQPGHVEGTRGHNSTRGGIVGGYEAVPGSWPWQAYLQYQTSPGVWEQMCGGTLISDQWIQTAAHCVYEALDPNDWRVVMGEFDDTKEDGFEQTYEVEAVFQNPQYEDYMTDYDTALLKVKGQVGMSAWVTPACYPTPEQVFPSGQMCITSGWGSIDPEGTEWGPTLKQDYAELWSAEECMGGGAYEQGWITDRMQCAGFHLTGGEDEERCASLGFGDSGGPLVCRDELDRWTVIGATSWGSLCTSQGYTPGVFARLQSMRDWIEATMDSNSENP